MPPIIFLHIPKTAGTTFNSILERQYKNQPTLYLDTFNSPERDKASFLSLSKKEVRSKKMIYGHFCNVRQDIIDRNIIAFFRKPIDQFLSEYYYIKGFEGNRFHQLVNTKLNTPLKYLHFIYDQGADNPQFRSIIKQSTFFNTQNKPYNFYNGKAPYTLSDNDLITISKSLDEELFLPLITERFDESLILLKKSLKWKKHIFYKTLNRSKKPKRLFENKFLIEFERLYKYDNHIYNQALSIYKNKIEEIGFSKKELETYKVKNKVFQFMKIAWP